MTPVRPVGTSSATLPRQRRPLGLRRPSFAQVLEDESPDPSAGAAAPAAVTPVYLIEEEPELGLPSPDAAAAARAFRRASARAAGRMRRSGQVVDVIV